MVTDLALDTREQLQRYVRGDLSNTELADWLAAAEYDSGLPQAERDILAEISLVLIEVEEGRRDTAEVLEIVAAVLAAASPEQAVTSYRSASETSWEGTPSRTATQAQLRRVGI